MYRSLSGVRHIIERLSGRPAAAYRDRTTLVVPLLLLTAAFAGATWTASAVAAEPVVLQSANWRVSIDPATLGMQASLGSQTLVLSEPRPAGRVEGLSAQPSSATWRLPDSGVSVTAKLDGDAVEIEVVHPTVVPGTPNARAEPVVFDWPIQTLNDPFQALLLPFYEGVYVPAGDAQWVEFLTKKGDFSTTADLSMPFWGFQMSGRSLSTILTNPYNSELHFEKGSKPLQMSLRHTFTPNVSEPHYGVRMELTDPSPIAPALAYREFVKRSGRWVSLSQKIERTPDVAKLLGAAHAYLWGDGLITRADFRDLKGFAKAVLVQSESAEPSVGKRLWTMLEEPVRKQIAELPAKAYIDNFDRSVIAEGVSAVLKRRDFFDPGAWKAVKLPQSLSQPETAEGPGTSETAGERGRTVRPDAATALPPLAEVADRNCQRLFAAFPTVLNDSATWGDAFSTKLMQRFADDGLDRLWLGSAGWSGLELHPDGVKKGMELGYLVGPYDSYHSMHAPGTEDTWETAQLGQSAFDSSAIMNFDGSLRRGFKQKGRLANPTAIRPFVERRVTDLMKQFRCNSWFVDCDGFGEVFDDYTPAHPSTQSQDAAARCDRVDWISKTYKAVVGTEGGSSYIVPAAAFSHGVMTPVIGWGDPELKDRQSPFYLGAAYPPDAPTVFFKQVPMKPVYRHIYADPTFRLPLYQAAYHDAIVTTHHWSGGSLKYVDEKRDRELLELLYSVPPLYHLNLAEWQKRSAEIMAHYRFFSPLHRQTALLPMTSFAWLTPDRKVQRCTFGPSIELVANFGDDAFGLQGKSVPPHSIATRSTSGQTWKVYP